MEGRGVGGRGSPERVLPGLPVCSGWLGEDDDVADAAGATTRRRPERRRGGGGRRGDDDEEEAAGAAAIEAAPARRGAQRARTFHSSGGDFFCLFFLSRGDFFYLRIFTFFYEGSLRIFTYVGPPPTDPRNTRAAKYPDVGFVPRHTWFEGRSTPIPEQLNKV
jgi:hypothetical protein